MMWPVGYGGKKKIIIAWFKTQDAARAYADERTRNTPFVHEVMDRRADYPRNT